MNVGKELAQKEDQTAQLLTPQARLALHTADAVEHTVLSEQIHEPLGVQDITLPRVVRAQDDREVGPLTLGQVAVGERQLGQVALKPALTFVLSTRVAAACDGAAPIARARLAAAAKAVIVFQR